MDRLIVLNIGDYWFPNARASVEAACNRWNLDLVELTQPIIPATTALSSKFYLGTLGFSKGTRCLFLDCDLVVRDDCPNPLNIVHPDHFGACQSWQGDNEEEPDPDRWHRRWFEDADRRMGTDIPYRLEDQINGGVLIWTAGVHDNVFKACRMVWGNAHPSGLHEQATMSWALLFTETPVHFLPPTFNRTRDAVWMGPARMNEYVYHFASYKTFRPHHKLGAIERVKWQTI